MWRRYNSFRSILLSCLAVADEDGTFSLLLTYYLALRLLSVKRAESHHETKLVLGSPLCWCASLPVSSLSFTSLGSIEGRK